MAFRQVLPLALLAGGMLASPTLHPVEIETRSSLDSRLANIHLTFTRDVEDSLTYTYASCSPASKEDCHHTINVGATTSRSNRLVWIIPEDTPSGGCILAWDSAGNMVGRSEPQYLHHEAIRRRSMRKRGENSIPMTNASGIDAWGAWFDGVALLEGKNISVVDVAEAKSKEVAIVGAGMSGLMTYLVLTQAGMTNVSIIEASQRLGGRVHTEYLSGGPFDYSYQEMGPMRFPTTYTSQNTTYNISDHQLVFQLAAEMNKINGYDKNLSVDFIPWYQTNKNGLVYKNGFKLDTGLPPTVAQIAANSSLSVTPVNDPSTQALSDTVNKFLPGEDFYVKMAQNMFKAHREWLENGLGGLPGDQWSEFAFMVNYLNATLNDTDVVGGGATSFWDTLYEGLYFGATTWRTIDGGLNRLPLSFHPLVDHVTTMNRKIERVAWLADLEKVELQWRDNYTSPFQAASYDYAVLALPFSIIKKWRLPSLPATISNAITNVPFTAACKVALEYRSRFWEQLENPIYGSCSTTSDIPGIGSICYPSYNINGTGPASILGSYISGDWGARWVSVPEAEHVQYVLDAMVEIHGKVAKDLYTGNYNRRCWMMDPYEGGSWASPTIGQHQLYLPEYFKTYNNMIFVGEQTSYTHAWIASALESGIRGSVQLLLELGLVDEAKAAVNKWMARWIDV